MTTTREYEYQNQEEVVSDESLFIFTPKPRIIHEAGIYAAEVTAVDVTKKQPSWLKSEDDDPFQYRITYAFTDHDGEPRTIYGYTDRFFGFTKDGNKYKTLQWVEAILGRPFPRDEWAGFDFRTLIGHKCRINLEDVKKDGSPGNRIVGVKPIEGPTGKAAKGVPSNGSTQAERMTAAVAGLKAAGWSEPQIKTQIKTVTGKIDASGALNDVWKRLEAEQRPKVIAHLEAALAEVDPDQGAGDVEPDDLAF
jgi:hypothetical protein